MSLTRRRFLSIAAAGTLVPGGASAKAFFRRTGRALGATTSLTIANTSEAEAEAIFTAVEAELARLERIFSLYDPASQLSSLNATGSLKHPAPELLEVLSLSASLNQATGGLFDPTIQPLWAHLAGLAPQDRAEELVGWRHVRIESHKIRLEKPGMQLTLNGIAQGYITDRIADLLRSRGLRQVLIDMGEIAAIGQKDTHLPWSVGVTTPDNRIVARLQLKDRALATSAPGKLILNPDLNTGHIIDPTGRAEAIQNDLVAISSPSAALADGLSTAGCLMTKHELLSTLNHYPSAKLEAIN